MQDDYVERNYIVNISQNYSRIYTKDYFLNADGITSWNNGALKFGDAFASICYLHGIYPETVFNEWDVLNDHFPEIGDLGKGENHPYTHKEQVEFILKYKTRTPKKILEIGCGRGEVAVFLSQMGYEVIAIEPCLEASEWLEETSNQYYGRGHDVTLLNGCVSQFVEDERLKGIDTVIMVESLEHILPKHFNPIYHRIMEEFKTQGSGHMIITNWIDYHPIPVGWMAPPEEHCRLTDDDLYDTMIEDFGKCIHREGSHLVLEWRD